MDATRDYHIKWSKSKKKDKYRYHLHVESKITQMNLSMKKSQTKRIDWWVPRGRGLGEGWSRRLELADVSFYTEWINNKILLYSSENCIQHPMIGTSLGVQSLGIHLPMQGTWVRALVWEDPTCHGATKPMHHNYWACAPELTSHNYWACVPQLQKPARLEPTLPKRSHHDEKPAHCNEE